MWQQYNNNSSDDDSDEEGTKFEISPPSYIIIAIDIHPNMFEKDGDSPMAFRMCLEAIGKLADAILFETSEKNICPFAIVLARKDNIIFRHFKSNLIETIKFINEKLYQSDEELKKEYMRDATEEFEMSNFLLQCKKVFLDVTKTYYKRILVYFTNDDYPKCAQDASGMFTIVNESRSLSHADVSFKVITTTDPFDYNKFYKEIFEAIGQDLTEEVCLDVLGITGKLRSIVSLTEGRKRTNFCIKIGDTEHCIQCYKFKPCQKPRILNNALYTYDGQQVKKAPSAAVRYRYRVVNKFNVSQFTYDQGTYERKTLDVSVAYGYTFLYVTKVLVSAGEQVNPPRLLICDPRATDEDKQLFRRLWDGLVEAGRVMVCHEKATRRAKLTYAQLRPYVMDDEQVFQIFRIPFGTQVKWPKDVCDAISPPDSEPDQEIRDLAARLVNAMTDDFTFDMLVHEKLKAKKEFVKSKLFDTALDTTGPIQYTRKQEANQKLALDVDLVDDVVAVIPPSVKRAPKRRRQ
ncbi:unnamed protein product [Callosobruchus maculatus]|uniref:Ku70/Ku80 N-terminal alpha/beta domain-containing protein n=1 Tax=Callosobruchus maculatus TaxID=64391 RepID=A0A653BM30_CALMS|nr:unnamed protein product [Callosobruchus maculatus]